MHKLLQFPSVGASGVNTDLPQWELPVDSLTEGRNYRIRDGFVTANGGYKLLRDVGIANLDIGRGIFVNDNGNEFFLVAGSKGVYASDLQTGTGLHGCNPPLSDATLWTFAMMGGIPIANHPENGMWYWYPVQHNVDSHHPLKAMPFNKTVNWDKPLDRSGRVLRSHKTFLFLLNLTEKDEKGTPQHMIDAFRWSHPAPTNAVPYTWDEHDQFALAGIANIGANTGAIIDGLSMRDSFVIYSESAITILNESGDVFVWNKRSMTSNSGLLAKDCVVEVKGLHYFMGTNDIYVFDGNQIQSLMHNRLRKHFMASLNAAHFKNSFAITNSSQKEIWFCIPDQYSQNGAVNLAYIYNWNDSSWAIRDLPCAPSTDPAATGKVQNIKHAIFGSRAEGSLTWDALSKGNPPPLYEGYGAPYGTNKQTPYDDTIIGIGGDNNLYDLDPTTDFATGDPGSTVLSSGMYIERLNFPINSVRNVTTLVTMYPKVKGVGQIKIKLGSHDYPGADVRWKDEVIFKIGVDRKVNMRTTGELHAWRIETVGAAICSFSGMDIEYSDAGLR